MKAKLAITYPVKRKRIKIAKWGTPKIIFLKTCCMFLI
jgi:hypothetical protein